jgi:hypothetical protein
MRRAVRSVEEIGKEGPLRKKGRAGNHNGLWNPQQAHRERRLWRLIGGCPESYLDAGDRI